MFRCSASVGANTAVLRPPTLVGGIDFIVAVAQAHYASLGLAAPVDAS